VTAAELAARIDHTLLRADATEADIERLCEEALAHRFAAVCTNSRWTARVAERLAGSGIAVCAVAAFPLGAAPPALKAREAAGAVELGAGEVDVVIDLGAARAGQFDLIRAETAAVKAAIGGAVLKTILETALLDEAAVRAAAGAARDGGADYLKTSTGFGPGGATVEAVRLLREVAGGLAKVKASGGIRSLEGALALTAAGADRLGMSASVEVVRAAGLSGA
jgi:deoxyribose-phosphate aldolase